MYVSFFVSNCQNITKWKRFLLPSKHLDRIPDSFPSFPQTLVTLVWSLIHRAAFSFSASSASFSSLSCFGLLISAWFNHVGFYLTKFPCETSNIIQTLKMDVDSTLATQRIIYLSSKFGIITSPSWSLVPLSSQNEVREGVSWELNSWLVFGCWLTTTT